MKRFDIEKDISYFVKRYSLVGLFSDIQMNYAFLKSESVNEQQEKSFQYYICCYQEACYRKWDWRFPNFLFLIFCFISCLMKKMYFFQLIINIEIIHILPSVKDHYNIEYYLCYYSLHDLINAFCTEIIREPKGYKYLWYKVHYRNLLREELRKKWSPDLIDFNIFFKNAENNGKQFLFNTKSKYSKKLDFEKFLEKLIRMKKALENKDKMRRQRQIQAKVLQKEKFFKINE